MTDDGAPISTGSRVARGLTLAGAVVAALVLALWWQVNWSPSAEPMPATPDTLAVELGKVARDNAEGWIALEIGLAVDLAMTPSPSVSTLAFLSPDGELVMTAEDAGGASLDAGRVRDALGAGADDVVQPLAISAKHRSLLVRMSSPLSRAAPSLGVVNLDTGATTRIQNCSAAFLEMTDAGFLLYGDCGQDSEIVVIDYASATVVEHYTAGVPEPWVWDERNDRFITISGGYSDCEPGGYLDDGRMVATCALGSDQGEFRAGAIEVGADYVGEVTLSDGQLVPLDGDELAIGYLGFEALAAGDILVANQSTTEGDPLLSVWAGEGSTGVNIDGSAAAAITERDGLVLVVNGTDAYGGDPSSGQALYWYDPASNVPTYVAAVPVGTRYVKAVPLS